ncbi:MAG: hypothetical protein LBL47_03320 [Lactobacillus sp.]|jgi:hypothetical protein|nr:hypothetical protein [Lactobacillus sp.]
MYTKYIQDVIENLSDEMFEKYLEFNSLICERKDMVGMSHHTLDIFRKK